MFRLSLMAIRKFNQDNEKKVAELKLQQALEEGERSAEPEGLDDGYRRPQEI